MKVVESTNTGLQSFIYFFSDSCFIYLQLFWKHWCRSTCPGRFLISQINGRDLDQILPGLIKLKATLCKNWCFYKFVVSECSSLIRCCGKNPLLLMVQSSCPTTVNTNASLVHWTELTRWRHLAAVNASSSQNLAQIKLSVHQEAHCKSLRLEAEPPKNIKYQFFRKIWPSFTKHSC